MVLVVAALSVCLALSSSSSPSLSPPSPPVTLNAAPGQGIVVVVGDDDFKLQVRGRMQVRAEAGTEDGQGMVGFSVRRLRLVMAGDVLRKQFSYTLQLGLSPRDVEADNPNVTRDAFVAWNLSTPFRLRLGQMKVPFDRQRMVSSASLQFPERSDIVNELTLDRDIGLVAFSAPIEDRFTYQLGVFGGDGRNRLNGDVGLLLTARVQWTPWGAFDDDLSEADLDDDGDPRWAIAAAVGYNAGSPRERSILGAFRPDERVDYLHGTADVLWKSRGLALVVQGIARVATSGSSSSSELTARSAVGAFAQLGLMVSPHAEVVGRIGHLEPIQGALKNARGLVRSDEVRVGMNQYILGHDVKISSDLGARFSPGAPVALDAHVMTQLAF